MLCKYCENEIPTGASVCPKCGKPVETIMISPDANQQTTAVASSPVITAEEAPKKTKKKSTSLFAPLAMLVTSAAGFFYFITNNMFESLKAWFTSTTDMNQNLSSRYNYGEASTNDEFWGNVLIIALIVIFALLALFGVILLLKRLVRKFTPSKK